MSNTDLIKIIALVWSQFFQWTLLNTSTQSLNLHASSSYFASMEHPAHSETVEYLMTSAHFHIVLYCLLTLMVNIHNEYCEYSLIFFKERVELGEWVGAFTPATSTATWFYIDVMAK